MLRSGSHLGLPDFEKFISVFPWYTDYIPTISTKSVQGVISCHDRKKPYGQTERQKDRQTDRRITYMPPAHWAEA